MTVEASAEVVSPELLYGPSGVMAASFLLEAVRESIMRQERIIREQIDPIEALIHMDPISSAIWMGTIRAGDVQAADRKASLAEVLIERR